MYRLKYRYAVDVEHETKVTLNFDITVATECKLIGADVVDVTGQAWVFEEVCDNAVTLLNPYLDQVLHLQGIVERPVSFQLSPREASNRMALQYAKSSLLKDEDGAKLSEVAIKAGFNATELYFVRVKDEKKGPKDSCRLSTLLHLQFQNLNMPIPYFLFCMHCMLIMLVMFNSQWLNYCISRFHGNVRVNKVTGNLHIIAGKSLPLKGGHAHLSFVGDHLRYNFSHRINHLSFGDMKVGFINVLDGDEFITDDSGI